MSSLKDALLKAGLKSTTPAAPAKKENEREKIKKKAMTEEISHQVQRDFCENCQNIYPDVEFYKHRNPTTDAEWICLKCADQLHILDKFRMTAQSNSSIKGLFRREYGETAKIEVKRNADPAKNDKFEKTKREVNGNR